MWLMNSLDLAIVLSYLTHVNPVNSLKQESLIESKIVSEIQHMNYRSMHLSGNGELRSEIYVYFYVFTSV